MDKASTQKSRQRLLLSAEPFGFGPTAAIAEFFPFLRERFATIGYVGTGHTLDLQRPLPYDAIHALPTGEGSQAQTLEEIFEQYDLVVTALDFDIAQRAQQAGLKVVIYDPLTWFWTSIHPMVARADLYIAQDFFGVRERIAARKELFRSPLVVPSIIPEDTPEFGPRTHILLNLGGLSNPYWSAEQTSDYARLIVEAFTAAVAHRPEPKLIAGNSAITRELHQFGVRNYSLTEFRKVIGTAKCALMTSGLGNIFDSALFGTPTLWLPPANDSQALQRNLLADHGMVDGSLTWDKLVPSQPVDYTKDQRTILQSIAAAVGAACSDTGIKQQLSAAIAHQLLPLADKTGSATSGLLSSFGRGGASQVAAAIFNFAQEMNCDAQP